MNLRKATLDDVSSIMNIIHLAKEYFKENEEYYHCKYVYLFIILLLCIYYDAKLRKIFLFTSFCQEKTLTNYNFVAVSAFASGLHWAYGLRLYDIEDADVYVSV